MEELNLMAADREIEQIVQLCVLPDGGLTEALPVDIAQVLQRYSGCFATPSTLPPHRSYDHRIVLLPDVQPVNVKPHRYSPQQKDDIECQICAMLQ
jgi:hypothetical protein